MNPKQGQGVSLDDVLFEFAVAQDRPDAELLSDFVRRFPQFAKELTDFSVAFALETCRGVPEDPESQPLSPEDNAAISRAMSRFQNCIYELAQEPQGEMVSREPGNPFAGFDVAAVDSFARRIHANRAFVIKLRDSRIDPDTMTPGFQRKMAEELRAPLDLVSAHFARPLQIRPTLRFKSVGKPTVATKQDFKVAVRNCGLSEDQQRWLLAL